MCNMIYLYHTAGCHLCEQAVTILSHLTAREPDHIRWEAMDIAGDEELLERYCTRIPVLQRRDSGAELGWPFGPDEILAFLSGSASP